MQKKITFLSPSDAIISGILSNPTWSIETPIMILCHGFTGNKNGSSAGLEKVLNAKNIATLRFDFRGHGESDGDFAKITVSEAVQEVHAAVEFVKKLWYSKIWLFGSSFGGMASLIAASEMDEEIEEWKKNSFLQYINNKGKEIRLNYSFFEDSASYDIYQAAQNISIPTLIMHGDIDTVVPIEQSKKTVSILSDAKLEVFPGVDHRYKEERAFDKMVGLVSEFVSQKLK